MNSKKFDIINNIFFGLIIILCCVLTLVLHLNWLSLVSCSAGIIYVVFLSEKNLLNFIVGFISSATYIVIAYQARLYGEAIFYLAFDIPMIFVSLFNWKKHMETKLKVESKKMSLKNILILCAVSAVSAVGYGFFLRFIGGENVFVDALSTIATLIGTILMALRYREQWVLWIIVNALSIILWSTTFNLLMLIMSISCLISSIIGYINWSLSAKKKSSPETDQTL